MIRILPPPFLPPLNTRALSPFSLITQQVEMTYQNSKSFLKRNRSICWKEPEIELQFMFFMKCNFFLKQKTNAFSYLLNFALIYQTQMSAPSARNFFAIFFVIKFSRSFKWIVNFTPLLRTFSEKYFNITITMWQICWYVEKEWVHGYTKCKKYQRKLPLKFENTRWYTMLISFWVTRI